jgi:hypothetical protein
MIDVTTNPTVDLLEVIIWVAVGLIALLIGIVGFLIKRSDDAQTVQLNKIESVVNTVKETADNLKTIVEVVKARQLGDGEVCKERHQDNLVRITELEETVIDHSNRITAVESKCKIHKDIEQISKKNKNA